MAGRSDTKYYRPNWCQCIKKYELTASFKNHICALIIARVIAWLYLQIINMWREKKEIYICMNSIMQMHFSASTIRSVLHSLHMVCEQYGILIWSFQRYGAHSAAQAPESESTCLICCRSRGQENDLFVKHIIKPTRSNGEVKLVTCDTDLSLSGLFYLSTQRKIEVKRKHTVLFLEAGIST